MALQAVFEGYRAYGVFFRVETVDELQSKVIACLYEKLVNKTGIPDLIAEHVYTQHDNVQIDLSIPRDRKQTAHLFKTHITPEKQYRIIGKDVWILK